MRDLVSNVKVKVGLVPAASSSTTDRVGEVIDRKGYDSLFFALITDGIAASSLAALLLIEESDDGSSFTAVADKDLIGTESDTAITATTDKADDLKVGYQGDKRYVRATFDLTTNNGTDVTAIVAVLGHPNHTANTSGA